MTDDVRWVDRSQHRAWLEDQFQRLVAFNLRSIRPEGGFHWLDAEGNPRAGVEPEMLLAARLVAVGAAAQERGIPGGGMLVEHGIASLLTMFTDPDHGGFWARPGARKQAYEHVHAAYAASLAVQAGSLSAQQLLDAAIRVIDDRFWDDEANALTESYAPDWSDAEDYRGANSNMHGVEAFLALASVTGENRWLTRALAVTDRLINQAARANDWLLPEHYTADWQPDLDHNRDDPRHKFRPYGWTPGHAVEWARLTALLADALDADPELSAPEWLRPAARNLLDTALNRGWAADGTPGFVYTTDWDGRPIEPKRLHWPLCEAIAAVAVLNRTAQDDGLEQWYHRLWDHAAACFVDTSTGSWRNELDANLQPAEDIWPGRPDAYHISGALLTPLDHT